MVLQEKQLLKIAVEAAEDKKAQNITVLDLQKISLIADYFIICHGNSDTQVQAITNEVKKRVQAAGITVCRVEGLDTARWVLLDLGDVIVHVFHREEREYYLLEKLWSDAKVVHLA